MSEKQFFALKKIRSYKAYSRSFEVYNFEKIRLRQIRNNGSSQRPPITNEAKYFQAIVDNGCPEGLEFSPTIDIIPQNLDSCSSRRRIFGGVSANSSASPWLAKIEIHNPTGDLTQCSGTILDDHWVLTAAGCCTGGTGGV